MTLIEGQREYIYKAKNNAYRKAKINYNTEKAENKETCVRAPPPPAVPGWGDSS